MLPLKITIYESQVLKIQKQLSTFPTFLELIICDAWFLQKIFTKCKTVKNKYFCARWCNREAMGDSAVTNSHGHSAYTEHRRDKQVTERNGKIKWTSK